MRHGLGLFLMMTVLVANATVARAETVIIGRATVIDGDTIEIQSERIRLNGIDAPKSAQLCHDGQQRPIAVERSPPRFSTSSSRPPDQHGAGLSNVTGMVGSLAIVIVRMGPALRPL